MLLGPLFRFELVRLARRGTHLPLRVVMAAVLFVGLLAAYFQLFPDSEVGELLFAADAADPTQLDRFAETFLLAFLITQQVAVLLLTPVYAGGAIAEEKEKGRLDFLLTSPLGRWELVVGKLTARLVFVLAVILAGLPVVSFTLLFGGVDPGRVLAGFTVAVVSAVAVGAFAVMLSVLRPTLRDVLLWVFFWLVVTAVPGLIGACVLPDQVGGLLSPVTVLITLFAAWEGDVPPTGDPTWAFVGIYSAFHLGLAMVCVGVAVKKVRTAAGRVTVTPVSVIAERESGEGSGLPSHPSPAGVASQHSATSPQRGEVGVVRSPATATGDVPVPTAAEPPLPDWYKVPERPVFSPDDLPSAAEGRGFLVPVLGEYEDPLAWKERHFAARVPLLEAQWMGVARGCAVGAFLVVLGLLAFVGLILAARDWLPLGQVFNPLAAVVLVVASLALPFAGMRAAMSVGEERAKKTLESLFVLPINRGDILWAKAVAAARRTRWWVGGAVVAVLVAAACDGMPPAALIAAPAVLLGSLAFSLGLGVWLGVRSKTAVRAALAHIVVTLTTIIGPVVAAPLVGAPAAYLSPPVLLFTAAGAPGRLHFGPSSTDPTGTAVCVAIPVAIGYAVAGLIAWQLAVRRFERE
jgi:ABC-type transport system involved in multi-copper enzyme maturation permease subunit